MIVLASFAFSSSDLLGSLADREHLGDRRLPLGRVERSPGGAAMTTRSAAPFWPPNFALIRSVAFWKSVPGTLNSLTSEPWKATFRPIRSDEDAEPGEDDPPRVRAQCAGDAGEGSGVGDARLFLEESLVGGSLIGHHGSLDIRVDSMSQSVTAVGMA